ncbi:MAG: signal peptidase I [Thaumarchaeota archaeon]|nr:signal peptidase I [Nitrososphaerota archaeon]
MNIKLKLIIGIAFIPLALYLWPEALGGETQYMLVQGQSMLGTIEPGSFVIIKAQESYEIDDIIGYSTSKTGPFGGRNVVHRIIQDRDDGGFILKGDNNPKKDPGVVYPDQILGEVVFFTPFAGYLLLFIRNPLVMVVLAIAAFMMQFGRKKKKPLPDLEVEKKPKKKKKKNYVLFVPALVITIAVYFVIQVSYEAGIDAPRADPFTTLLYNASDVYLGSTIAFALYFLLMLGLYYVSKSYDTIPRKILPSGSVLTLKKKTNYSLASARMVWLAFILSGIYFLFLMLQDLQAEFV